MNRDEAESIANKANFCAGMFDADKTSCQGFQFPTREERDAMQERINKANEEMWKKLDEHTDAATSNLLQPIVNVCRGFPEDIAFTRLRYAVRMLIEYQGQPGWNTALLQSFADVSAACKKIEGYEQINRTEATP